MIRSRSQEQLIKHIRLAFIAQVTLTSLHHVYGGLVYESTFRLSMPVIAVIELLIVLGLLAWYKVSENRAALALFTLMVVLVGVVQGLFHTLYGHLYKDLLFLAGVPRSAVLHYFAPLLPNDFIYPPNDLIFEITGVLELLTICFIMILTSRLIRSWWQARHIESIASTVGLTASETMQPGQHPGSMGGMD
jgi:hypothetical protein